MTRTEAIRLASAGAASGGSWFFLALAFDKGVRDFNIPVIPTKGALAQAGSFLSAVATGVAIVFVFRRFWSSDSRWAHWLIPYAALAASVACFSSLLRIVVLLFGASPNAYPFGVIVSNLGAYALISVFTPILYGFAQLNRIAMRNILRRALTLGAAT